MLLVAIVVVSLVAFAISLTGLEGPDFTSFTTYGVDDK